MRRAIVPMIVVTAMLIGALISLTGCEPASAPPREAREEAAPETPAAVEAAEPRETKKETDPVLASARTNALFDVEKWLESDYRFLRRTNPRRISKYDRTIKKMARRYGFDWRLIAAQIFTESTFRSVATSGAGAVGLMQVLPNTAKFMGTDPDDLLTPEVNIAVGCLYNQRLYSLWRRQTEDKTQRLAFALASYNAGRGRVLRSYSTKDSLVTWTAVHPRLPEETQNYVHKIYLKHDQYKRHVIP